MKLPRRMLIDTPPPMAPEAEQRAFVKRYQGTPDANAQSAVEQVRQQLKERTFDPMGNQPASHEPD